MVIMQIVLLLIRDTDSVINNFQIDFDALLIFRVVFVSLLGYFIYTTETLKNDQELAKWIIAYQILE